MTADHCDVGSVPIDILPEDVLLEIFCFYLCAVVNHEEWETLVYVCRRWRSIVLSAPVRLGLRLVCTYRTPVRKKLEIWLALPISIWLDCLDEEIEDELLAALENKDRICEIYVHDNPSDHGLELLAEATEDPFPALTDLHIESVHGTPVVPDSLLRGSVPHLRLLHLERVRFPAFPKLLLSATGLVDLSLCDFAGLTPWMMVDYLPSLNRLEKLRIEDRYSEHCPDQASGYTPPLTRIVLPVLTTIAFKGGSEYLDHFFSHFDASLLNHVDIMFDDPAVFCFSQISQFIGRKESFEAFDQAHMWLRGLFISLILSSRKPTTGGMWLSLSMWCEDSIWQLQSLTQVHHRFIPPFVTNGRFDDTRFKNVFLQTGNAQWLEFVRFFTAVENLYLSERLAGFVAPVLGELSAVESATTARDVLPALQTLFIESLDQSECGRVREAIGKFVVERELTDHPVAVHRWERESYN